MADKTRGSPRDLLDKQRGSPQDLAEKPRGSLRGFINKRVSPREFAEYVRDSPRWHVDTPRGSPREFAEYVRGSPREFADYARGSPREFADYVRGSPRELSDSSREFSDSSRGSPGEFSCDERGSGEESPCSRRSSQDRADKSLSPPLTFKNLGSVPDTKSRPALTKFYQAVEGQLKKWCSLFQSNGSEKHADKMLEKWAEIQKDVELLLETAEKIYSVDHGYYMSKELYLRVWMHGMYPFVNALRNCGVKKNVQLRNDILYQLLRLGILHIQFMADSVSSLLSIDMKPIFSRSMPLRMSTSIGKESPGEEMLYRCFLVLGDMYRYRHLIDGNIRDARMTRSMYVNAKFCDTMKSRSYNQLAVVARSEGNMIEAIFNFTRAIHSKNPTNGAYQELQSVYDDLSKVYGENKLHLWYTRSKIADELFCREWRRHEVIWIPDAKADYSDAALLPKLTLPPQRSRYLEKSSLRKLYYLFNLTFGHFCGILYLNIGSDNAIRVSNELLVYFEGLVTFKEFNDAEFYLEVIALLLFLIVHQKMQEPNRLNQQIIAHKKEMRNLAFTVSLKMMIMLVHKLLLTIKSKQWNSPMLIVGTATLHIWIIFVKRHEYFFMKLYKQAQRLARASDPRKSRFSNSSRFEDCESFMILFYQLFTQLKELIDHDTCHLVLPKAYPTATGRFSNQLGLLSEQKKLDGFKEVLESNDINTSKFFFCCGSNDTKEMEQTLARISAIIEFGNAIFTGVRVNKRLFDPTNLPLNVADIFYQDAFKVLSVLSNYKKVEKPTKVPNTGDCNNARIIVRSQPIVNEVKFEGKFPPPVIHTKLDLTATLSVSVEEIIARLSYLDLRTKVIVRPLRVVLDTNTFLNSLAWVKALMYYNPHKLIVPTTVLMELRGLAKGAKSGTSPKFNPAFSSPEIHRARAETIMQVGEDSLNALSFLDEHKRYFRVITVEGREMKFYKFKTQKIFDTKYTVRNDEKILETCCQMEKLDHKARQLDNSLFINRSTVLLTGDRSLRVRALVHEIHACDIQSFTKWIMKPKSSPTETVSPRKSRNIQQRPESRSRLTPYKL